MSLSLPVLIYLFAVSVEDVAGYRWALSLLDNVAFQLAGIVLLWALLHHFLAGIRFLLIDLDIGVNKPAARAGAWTVNIGAAALTAVMVGVLFL